MLSSPFLRQTDAQELREAKLETYSILQWLLLNTAKPHLFYFQIAFLQLAPKGEQHT